MTRTIEGSSSLRSDTITVTVLLYKLLWSVAVVFQVANKVLSQQYLKLCMSLPSFIHSFIHSGDLYSASSRHYYSEALPAQSRPKKKDLREMQNLEGRVISKERSSTGRSFHVDGPTTEKALRRTVAKWARGTKNSPLAAERRTRRAAKIDTGH